MINNIPRFLILLILLQFTFNGCSQPMEKNNQVMTKTSDTLTLKVSEVKAGLENEVKIKYSSYSHEHSSSSPDQPFEANVGVYNFEMTAGGVKEAITIYMGTTQISSAVDWKQYKITLLSVTPDQKEVVISISLK